MSATGITATMCEQEGDMNEYQSSGFDGKSDQRS